MNIVIHRTKRAGCSQEDKSADYRHLCPAAARKNGCENCRFHHNDGASGANADHPEFQRMSQDVKKSVWGVLCESPARVHKKPRPGPPLSPAFVPRLRYWDYLRNNQTAAGTVRRRCRPPGALAQKRRLTGGQYDRRKHDEEGKPAACGEGGLHSAGSPCGVQRLPDFGAVCKKPPGKRPEKEMRTANLWALPGGFPWSKPVKLWPGIQFSGKQRPGAQPGKVPADIWSMSFM